MNNCLVTKFKGSVSSPLVKLNEITFKAKTSTGGETVIVGSFNALQAGNYVENVTTGQVFNYNGGANFLLNLSPGDIVRAFSKNNITFIGMNNNYLFFDITLPENIAIPGLERIEASNGGITGNYTALSQYEELTYIKMHRSQLVGTIESLVEFFITEHPSKQKTLFIQHYQCYGITFNGTAVCPDAATTYKINIAFSGSGTAVVSNADTSDVLGSYDGTSWTYA